jgi:hypothetical protein
MLLGMSSIASRRLYTMPVSGRNLNLKRRKSKTKKSHIKEKIKTILLLIQKNKSLREIMIILIQDQREIFPTLADIQHSN